MDIVRCSLIVALLALGVPRALVAQERLVARSGFSLAIDGAKQGLFPGSQAGIAGLRYSYILKSPRDVASGQATGKRQHAPVVFTKSVGLSSPQIFQALATNEALKSVVVNLPGSVSATGVELPGYRITLTNAAVVEVKQYTETVNGRATVLEDVSFTFQRIEVEDPATKSVAMDDWMAPMQ
jgi:type VI secretion system secreted protein Hcp